MGGLFGRMGGHCLINRGMESERSCSRVLDSVSGSEISSNAHVGHACEEATV